MIGLINSLVYNYRFWRRRQGWTSTGGIFICTECGAEVPAGTPHRQMDCIECLKQSSRLLYQRIRELEGQVDVLSDQNDGLSEALCMSLDDVGRIIQAHKNRKKRLAGYHTPTEMGVRDGKHVLCMKCDHLLVPFDELGNNDQVDVYQDFLPVIHQMRKEAGLI